MTNVIGNTTGDGDAVGGGFATFGGAGTGSGAVSDCSSYTVVTSAFCWCGAAAKLGRVSRRGGVATGGADRV